MAIEYKVDRIRSICAEYINATDWSHQVDRMDRESRLYYYREADQAMNSWYLALRMACEAVGADMKKVIAFEKAVRRNTQYRNHWEHEPQLSWWNMDRTGTEDSYRKAVAEDTTSRYFNY